MQLLNIVAVNVTSEGSKQPFACCNYGIRHKKICHINVSKLFPCHKSYIDDLFVK